MHLLTDNAAEVVVDVRKLPGSDRNPQFNADALVDDLAESGIELQRLEGLTGRRPVNHDIDFAVNGWWKNRSFHNYADHTLTGEFRQDFGRLLEWGAKKRCVLMCSEAVWWRCHRRIIADNLLAREFPVTHIMGRNQTTAVMLSAGADVAQDGSVTYPAVVSDGSTGASEDP
ncbi:DUF488 domain-containing protein [Brevibacterium marinum]|uniref:Uncharacterized protein (DUF488 family) n=2 Tax=Brevibacterium marinum TaxID=418643 RepID=A0A846RPF3_9MICO|nr:uncharacterized protein (DUF488 family) [Brevibacterium marinum]